MGTHAENGGNRREQVRVRRVDCVECGSAHYWCDACRRAVCSHVGAWFSTKHPLPQPTRTALSSLEPLRAFVAWVLADVSPEATLVEFTDTPEGTYGLRIKIARAIGELRILPRCLVENAVIYPVALASLRAILRAEPLAIRGRRVISDDQGVSPRASLTPEDGPLRAQALESRGT